MVFEFVVALVVRKRAFAIKLQRLDLGPVLQTRDVRTPGASFLSTQVGGDLGGDGFQFVETVA
jgi:hypothetical protein